MIPIQFRPPVAPKGVRGSRQVARRRGRGAGTSCAISPGVSGLTSPGGGARHCCCCRVARGPTVPVVGFGAKGFEQRSGGYPFARPISGAASGSARFVVLTNRDFKRQVGSQLQHAVSSQSRPSSPIRFAPTALAEECLPAKVYYRSLPPRKSKIYPISTPLCNRIPFQIGLFTSELHRKPPNGLAGPPGAIPVGLAGIPLVYESGARGESARVPPRRRPSAPLPRQPPTTL